MAIMTEIATSYSKDELKDRKELYTRRDAMVLERWPGAKMKSQPVRKRPAAADSEACSEDPAAEAKGE
eukprot:1120392-Alexandrium_andersonii.AAC.1